jgi:hypothetical protein
VARRANVEPVQEQIGRDMRMAVLSWDVELRARAVDAPDIEMHLQAAGEALLAVHDHTTEHQDLLRRISAQVAALLNERGWSGDGQLAALLLEPPATASTRRRVRADLDQVADLLEGSLEMGFGGVLDRQTGHAWPESIPDDWSLDEPCPDPDTEPERYLLIPNEGSRDAWHDMHDFATGLADAHLQEQLLDAIDDRGAFGRFTRILDRHDDLWPVWNTHSTEARRDRARSWHRQAGYDALPAPR